jgi:hypothetical protein
MKQDKPTLNINPSKNRIGKLKNHLTPYKLPLRSPLRAFAPLRDTKNTQARGSMVTMAFYKLAHRTH